MAYTQKFRDQHTDLLGKAAEIGRNLNEDTLKKDASLVRDLLSGLLGKLKIHLAVEDKALYPQLKACGNQEVAAVATQYQKEMGGIGEFVATYSKNWPSRIAISDNPQAFIKETNQLIAALAERIEKENNHLYNLADANL